MKYFLILLIVVSCANCSPKMAPDATWGQRRWVLIEMKEVPVQLSGGRRDAFINFNVAEKRFSGNGGCNQINGSYTLNKNDIRFSEVTSTKMACEDLAFENTFLQLLNSVDGFEQRGNDLLLKRKREVLLRLTAK
jgi:heat shock protein HslJ